MKIWRLIVFYERVISTKKRAVFLSNGASGGTGLRRGLKILGSQELVGSTPTSPTISKEKFTRLADVANNMIIKIEAGKNQNPTLDTLKKIAKALEVSVDDLIS